MHGSDQELYKRVDVEDFEPRPVASYPRFTPGEPVALSHFRGSGMWQKIKDWLIVKLGGVPAEWYRTKAQWQKDALGVIRRYEQETAAQRDRIEQFILRETFGDRQFLARRYALKQLLQTRGNQAIAEVIEDTFSEFFKTLALYEAPRSGGHTSLLSETEDET